MRNLLNYIIPLGVLSFCHLNYNYIREAAKKGVKKKELLLKLKKSEKEWPLIPRGGGGPRSRATKNEGLFLRLP